MFCSAYVPELQSGVSGRGTEGMKLKRAEDTGKKEVFH